MPKYNRNITELRTKAALWWPEELKNKNALANVLPLLLKTQEDFLRLIVLSKNDPFQLFDLINPTCVFQKSLDYFLIFKEIIWLIIKGYNIFKFNC